MPRCHPDVQLRRHPFEVAPYMGVACPPAAPLQLALEEGDESLIRRLRPETTTKIVVTLGTAALSIALYSGLWDLRIAAGLVLGMAFHELGHSLVLRKFGLATSPIVFLPFIGAMQRVRVWPERAADTAFLALAGPACSMAFAGACKLGHALTDDPALRFLAAAHAILALIDLVPFGLLDGARAARALSRRDCIACAYIAITFAVFAQFWLLVPLGLGLAWTSTKAPLTPAQPAVSAAFLILAGSAYWLV